MIFLDLICEDFSARIYFFFWRLITGRIRLPFRVSISIMAFSAFPLSLQAIITFTQINIQLKDLASKKNVDLPTSVSDAQQKDIDKLSKKTGKEFDKDYVKMMIKDHKDDIDAFKKAGDKLSDSDYKNFIQNTIPTLQKHLNAIEEINKHM